MKKYFGYLVLLVYIFFVVSLIKNFIKVFEANKRVERERERLEKLKRENEELEKEAKNIKSGEFVEKQLRDKLGLAKKGEIVLVLPDEDTLRKLAPQIPEEEETLPDPNWKRWLKLFF